MNRSIHLIFLTSIIFAIFASGCASDEAVPVGNPDVVSVNGPPPPPRSETVPPSPNPNWYWAPGFWQRQGDEYVWMHGHWVEPRPSQVYVNSYWTVENGTQVFHEGRWVNVQESPQSNAVISSTTPLPPPQPDTIPPSPGPDYFWINGQYQWENGNYVWNHGHWEQARAGQVWIPQQWVPDGNGGSKLVGGYWQPD